MGTQNLKKVPMGTQVPKWGPTWEQCRGWNYLLYRMVARILIHIRWSLGLLSSLTLDMDGHDNDMGSKACLFLQTQKKIAYHIACTLLLLLLSSPISMVRYLYVIWYNVLVHLLLVFTLAYFHSVLGLHIIKFWVIFS